MTPLSFTNGNGNILSMPDGAVIFRLYLPAFSGTKVNLPRPSCSVLNEPTCAPPASMIMPEISAGLQVGVERHAADELVGGVDDGKVGALLAKPEDMAVPD